MLPDFDNMVKWRQGFPTMGLTWKTVVILFFGAIIAKLISSVVVDVITLL